MQQQRYDNERERHSDRQTDREERELGEMKVREYFKVLRDEKYSFIIFSVNWYALVL